MVNDPKHGNKAVVDFDQLTGADEFIAAYNNETMLEKKVRVRFEKVTAALSTKQTRQLTLLQSANTTMAAQAQAQGQMLQPANTTMAAQAQTQGQMQSQGVVLQSLPVMYSQHDPNTATAHAHTQAYTYDARMHNWQHHIPMVISLHDIAGDTTTNTPAMRRAEVLIVLSPTHITTGWFHVRTALVRSFS